MNNVLKVFVKNYSNSIGLFSLVYGGEAVVVCLPVCINVVLSASYDTSFFTIRDIPDAAHHNQKLPLAVHSRLATKDPEKRPVPAQLRRKIVL